MPTTSYYRNSRRIGNRSWSDRDDRERDRERYDHDSRYGSDPDKRHASGNRNYSQKNYNRNYSGRNNDHGERQYIRRYGQERNRDFSEHGDRGTYNRNYHNAQHPAYRDHFINNDDGRRARRNYFGFPGRPYEYDERNEGYAGRNSSDYSNDHYGNGYYYSPNDERYSDNRYEYEENDHNNYYHGPGNHPGYDEERWYGRDYDNSYVDIQEARNRAGVDNEDTTDQFYPRRERPRRRELVENGW